MHWIYVTPGPWQEMSLSQALARQRSLLMSKTAGKNSSLGAPFPTQVGRTLWQGDGPTLPPPQGQGTRLKWEPAGAQPGNGLWKVKLLICWFSKLTYQQQNHQSKRHIPEVWPSTAMSRKDSHWTQQPLDCGHNTYTEPRLIYYFFPMVLIKTSSH